VVIVLQTVKIGNVILESPLVLAPMAGVTNSAFRLLAKEMGCALVYSEMVSAKGLVYRQEKTKNLLRFFEEERPISVQIFGSDPDVMGEAAAIVADEGADIIDINMGCPVPKVVKNGEGAALMREPRKAYAVMKAVKDAVRCPVTVKIRKGWDENEVNALQIGRLVEDAGLDALTIHGRTREQFYSGTVDWTIIGKLAKSLSIPVIGSGDIASPQDVQRMLSDLRCAAAMIGRAALGNPWIFKHCLHYLKTGEMLLEPTLTEKVKMSLRHLQLLIGIRRETVAVKEMRKHIGWYLKGVRGVKAIKLQINKAETEVELRQILFSLLEKDDPNPIFKKIK
jgi:tRNA-dihydrouridine synthase B